MGGGLTSSGCGTNPTFCNFNQVFFRYCDGNSFSGAREDPVPVGIATRTNATRSNSTSRDIEQLWFRGAAIVTATLQHLVANHGLGDATQVLVTGCSAGGLAAILQADNILSFLEDNTPAGLKYKVAPVSGFFLLHDNVLGQPVHQRRMQNIFNLSHAVAGVGSACVAAAELGEEWRCNFAGPMYAHTRSPMFIIDSALDSWQTNNILALQAPGWGACGGNVNQCTPLQMYAMISYQASAVTQLTTTPTWDAPGNGCYLDSCFQHCAAHNSAFWETAAIDGVSLRDAVELWWRDTEGAQQTLALPCLWPLTGGQCNPTCQT